MPETTAPTLIVHGTDNEPVPFDAEASRPEQSAFFGRRNQARMQHGLSGLRGAAHERPLQSRQDSDLAVLAFLSQMVSKHYDRFSTRSPQTSVLSIQGDRS